MTKTPMIKYAPRESGSNKENVVAAATHGRGLCTSKFLTSANREGKQLDNLSDAPFISDSKLIISPNPAQDFFQIHISNQGETLQVFSIDGVLLKEQEMNEGIQSISTLSLANGMYVVKLKGKSTNSKLVISR